MVTVTLHSSTGGAIRDCVVRMKVPWGAVEGVMVWMWGLVWWRRLERQLAPALGVSLSVRAR